MKNKEESDKNIVWHQSAINKEDRRKLNGHKSLMIWLTGLSGSGKSTIANALQHELYKNNVCVYLLDGDNLRHGINSNLSFSPEDRKENIRRTAEIGKLFVDAGIVVLAAVISPFEEDRLHARAIFQEDEFIEVYVKCSLLECEKRDPKGLYKKARNGEIKQFTGIDQPYEEPENPEVVLDTTELSLVQSVELLSSYIFEKVGLKQNAKE
ncbi:adenylyl-sulfate kinase [Bacillus sp. CMF12]|uniref:adenylyl-sulfate kinase n=1 Tax=Bacillaceae TaxID=186817 RepID=UPI001FB23CBC|nr:MULTISPECIES: adenylyl-sulfate kinase [Bacillaceae]UOE53101.1 adenylyl-sulfate kinase [Cytobacillus oceanisediminis]USK52310.1 adenylyl-sulfate kinase [Bacillus sp. CMF12]